MNSRKKIAIAAGGDSSEYSISMKSASVVQQHLQANFDTYLIEIKGANWRYLDQNQSYEIDKNDFSLPLNGETIRFDLVFIAIHGTPGEDGKLQGYLDMLKIPYTSSNLLASAVSFNKGVTNDYLKSHGIRVAKSVQLFQGIPFTIEDIVAQLGLPCFVKPNQSGSSFGVQKVKKIEDLPQAIDNAFEIDRQVLIESFVQGREVTCGVNNFEGKLTAMPITEIISENEFFDFSAKYEGKSQEITPADLPDESTKKVQELSKKVFQLLGLNGVARVDFIIQDNEPHLIEANTVPGLSAESIIPQQARAMGYSLTDFFTAWVNHFL